jgi:NADH-quinone oxidoreductase subunit F
VDLRLTAKAAATDQERAAVDAVLRPPESGWEGGERRAQDAHTAFGGHAARGRRHLLITVLHAVQERVGWISPGTLDYVAERLTVPPAEAFGVASFYAMFRTTRRRPARSCTSATTWPARSPARRNCAPR